MQYHSVSRLLAGTALLCTFSSVNADQLLVTAANADGNSVYDLAVNPSATIPPTPVIASTTIPVNTTLDAATHGAFDALVWVPNAYCKTLDLIVADAAKGQIVRYSGATNLPLSNCYVPSNGTPAVRSAAQVIFQWTTRGSGPAQPNGLSADANGNLFVISSTSLKDLKPSIWVLPFNQSANQYCSQPAGLYCAPVLIDNTFSHTLTLFLGETLVASTTTPLWNAGDLLVLVGDSFDARLTVYSQSKLYSNGTLATSTLPLSGPSSVAIPWSKFLQLLAAPFGMDVWPADATHGTSVLFTTIDGRILRFDTGQSAFVANFASGLGLGLQKLKVGAYANTPYAFVAQLGAKNTGKILAFAAPPSSGTNTPLAVVSSGVSDPVGLAVSNSGSQSVPTVTTGTACAPPNPACTFSPLGPELTTTLVAYPGDNLTGTVTEQSCTVASDPRVSTADGWSCSGANLPIGAGTAYCPTFPATIVPGSICGHSGPSGSGFAVVEATATGIDPNDNNSFLTTTANADVVLPGPTNLECATFSTTGQIPLVAWGTRSDLTTVEGTIPEDSSTGAGALTELTGSCDPSTTGARGVSMYAFGLALNLGEGGINSYVDTKYANLLSTINAASIASAIQSTLVTDITTSQSYFDAGNNNCALNELFQADSFVRANANPTNFMSNLGAGGGNPNPAGDIDGRIANLYLTINTEVAGNPPNPTWPVPATGVPACTTNVIFDNTGGGIEAGGLQLGEEVQGANYALGFLVTATASGNLGSISAPMAILGVPSASVTFNVYTNSEVGTPGQLLDTLTATVAAFNAANVVNPIVVFPSTNNPFLNSGQSIWVIASLTSSPAPGSLAIIAWDAVNVLAAPGSTYCTENTTVITCGGGDEGAMTLTAVPIIE
jgi:hypothetical protein